MHVATRLLSNTYIHAVLMETYSLSPFSMEASQEQCNDELDNTVFQHNDYIYWCLLQEVKVL